MNETPSQSDIALQKPSPGSVPKRRVPTALDCYSICSSLVHANAGRSERAAVIRLMVDGAPPYSPSRLRTNNQAWRANFSTLEAESIVSNAVTPYYDLFTNAAPLVEVELDTDNSQRDRWSAIAADEFHRFFYGYKGVEFILWPMLNEFVLFNKSYLFWPQVEDPWFKHRSWVNVLFPDGSGLDPDEWEQFAVRQQFTVSRLWRYLESGGKGWNRQAVLAAIARAVPEQPQSVESNHLAVEQQMRDCDINISTRSEMVRAVSLFVKELSGKWSWLMVSESDLHRLYPAGSMSINSDELRKNGASFLFERYAFYDDPSQIIAPFVFEAASDSINSFAGLGRKVQPLMALKDRFWCQLADGGMLRSTPLLAAQDASSLQKGGITQLGYATIISPGLQLQQTNLLADIEGPLAILQSLDNLVETNTGIFKPRLEKPRGNPETATAANLRFQNATVLTNSAVNRFYDQMDYFLAEVWRRATLDHTGSSRPGSKAAKVFQDRCRERGVDLSVLRKKPFNLSMTRVIGNGSPFQRQQSTQAMAPLATAMGPRGRLNWQMDYTAAYGGHRAVLRYWPVDDQLRIPDRNVWDAEQENALMQQGQKPTIIDGQDHQVHLQEHVKAMATAVQAVQQGGDPMAVLAFVQVGLAHAGEHVASLPEKDQKPWVEALGEISQAAAQIQQAVQQQQEEQQRLQAKAQQQTFEQQLAQQKLQAEMQLKQEKNAAQMQQRQERHMQDQQLADVSTAADIQRQTAVTATDIATKRAKTQADVAAQKMKATAAAKKPTSNK